jgi:hypothetical protein
MVQLGKPISPPLLNRRSASIPLSINSRSSISRPTASLMLTAVALVAELDAEIERSILCAPRLDNPVPGAVGTSSNGADGLGGLLTTPTRSSAR